MPSSGNDPAKVSHTPWVNLFVGRLPKTKDTTLSASSLKPVSWEFRCYAQEPEAFQPSKVDHEAQSAALGLFVGVLV